MGLFDHLPDATSSQPTQPAAKKPGLFDHLPDAEPVGFTGAVARGFKRSLPETKSLLAGAGAAAAGAVGLDGVRDKLLDTYQGIQQNEVAPLQAKTGFIDAVTGDGSLKEWAGDTLGNFGGQALQSVAAAGAGALVGSLVPGAGTVAGGVGGLLFKAGAKEMVTDAVGRMVAKGVAKDVAEKTALRRLGGAAIAGTGLNVGQEIGTGYTGRAEDAKQSGEQLTQTDALRAIGYGIPAGLVDTAAEALTGSRLMRGVSDSPKMLSRMAKGAGIGAVSEGATEGVQAVLERAGANQALTGDAAYRDYIENIAAGALGGGVAGAGGGFRRQQDPAAPPPPETPPPMTPEVNASQALPPAPSPLATPPVGPMTRAAATVPGAPPLATPPATTAADTAQTPTDALPPLIADTAGQAVAAPPAADPVFEKAKELLAAAGKVNRKQLRADLGIKENQMQTLLDQLHAAGIVGPSNGNKARKLLVNPITGDVLDPDEKARLDRKVERDAQQRALEEAVRGGKPAAAIEAAAAAQGQQPEAAQTPSPLSRPPMTPEFEAKMRERQAAALTRAQRPDPATGATSKAAAVAFDTGAAAAAEQQAAQAAQDQQAQAAVTAQAEADKAQQQQQKMAEKAAKEADKAARQAEKDRVQAEKTAPAQDVDIQAVVAAEIESGKPMDGMRMHALAKKLNVTPKRIDDMRMALAQKRKRGEPLTAPTADAVQNLDPIAQGVQNVDTQDQFAEPSKMVDQYDDSPDVTEDDITPPSGGAFSIRSAAESTAKRTPGGKVFEVDGGFVVRVPRAVVNESLTTAPDPGLEDALRQERDAYTNERDDAYLNKTKHARDPLKDAVEDAVNASVLDPDAARVVLDVALSNGRVDLAEYAVSRAERAVAGMSVTPGVPQNSPKYADIKAALESRKREATALLDSLKKDLAAAKTATVKESLTVAAAKPKEAIATDVAGEQLDDKWTAFAPETGTLNVPRADMPQVKSEHRGAMVQYLAARGITHEQAEVPADSLKPTQAEFSAAKVKKALKRAAEGEDRAILVSADGHVLDGHHQWLAKREAGAPVKVIRLNAPIADLLQQVKEFPSSTQAKGATAAAPANTARSVVESELAAGDKSNPQLVAAMRSKDATKFVDLGLVELPDKLIDRGTRIERLAEEIASEPRGAFRSTIYNLGDGRNQYSYVVSDGTGKPTNVGKHDRNDERWTPAQVADRLFESEVYDARQQLRKEAYEAQTTEAAKGFKEGQKVGAFDIYVNSKLRKFRSGVIESIQGDALQMLATMVGVKADSHRLTISILNLKEGIERAAERKPAETTQEPTNAKQEAPRTEQAAATGQAAAEAKPEALLDQKAAQRAAIDAETMETRGDAPQVAQPTKGKRITVNTVTLNGPTTVLAHLYELPNYNGPQLAVSEKKRGNQTPYYRVYLPKSGAFIADNPSTASDLAETLKLAVLRIQNARDALQKAKAKPEKADDAKSSSSRQVEAPGLSTAALEAFLKPATEALRKDGVQIHVITTAQLGESTGDAAEDDRRAAMKRGMGNKKSRASVSGDRQHVYFFADKIKTIEEAGRVAAHELVGHIGMERLLGGRWAELRAAVLRLRDAGKWPELFDEVRARYASNPDGTARGMDDDTFAAEAIAVFAERNVKTNILQAAMVAARGWLRRTFPNQEIEISQDELRQLVWEAGRMVKGKRFRSGVVEDVLGSAEPAAGSDVNPDDLARALRTAQVAEPEPAKPKGTMARKLMPRGDAVAEVQRQLKVTKKRATEIVNEIKSEAKNLDGVTYNLKPGIVQTADVQAAIERERAGKTDLGKQKVSLPEPVATAPATHTDPGQPAEPVTAPVIAEAIKTSAAKTPLNLKEARAWLLERVDEALKGAPKSGANVTVSEPRTEDGRKVRDVSTDVVDPVSGASRPHLRVVEIKVADSGSTYNIMHGNKVLDRQDGSLRFAILTAENLLLASKWQPAGGKAGSWDFTGSAPADFVTFDVPGDGKFKVLNTRENLQAFRAKVAASSGFRADPGAPRGPTGRMSVPKGASWEVIDSFLEDDEFGNVYTYANAVDQPLMFGLLADTKDVVAYGVASSETIAGLDVFVGKLVNGPTKVPSYNRNWKRATWHVVDKLTGAMIGFGDSKADALAEAAGQIKKAGGKDGVRAKLEKAGAGDGLSMEQRKDAWLKKYAPDVLELVNGEVAPVAKAAKPQQRAVQPAPAQPQDENAKAGKKPVTPQVPSEWQLEQFIKIAADSVESLRPVDVERVIRETPAQHRQAVAEYIKKNRYGALDLEVDDVARELGVTMTPVAPDLKGFKLEQTDSAAFDLVDGNMRVSVVPMADGKFQASYRGAKSSPHLQSKQAAIDWAAGYRDEAKRLSAPASSVQGQKNMAARGGRIATLMAMNGRLRKLDPDSAWLDSNIEQADDLDALQDQISEALARAERGKQPTNALRAELEQMSGAELRVVFDRMRLAGTRMTHIERVDALMAEGEAEVRAAMAAVQPEATTGPADAKGERKFYVTMIRDSKVARIAGPFDTKEEADAILPAARDKAKEVDPRAVFDAFGVSAVTMEEHKPAALNEQLGIGKAATPAIPEGYKPTGEPYYVGKDLVQGYAKFPQGERVKLASGIQGVVTGHIGKGPILTRAMVKFDNGTESGVDERELVAVAAAQQDDDAPTMTRPEARELMFWQDMGQKDGEKSHRLTFYTSKDDAENKRGSMTYGKITKDQGSSKWFVEDGDSFTSLADAKRQATEMALDRAEREGFIAKDAPAKQEAQAKATATPPQAADFPDAASYHAAVAAYRAANPATPASPKQDRRAEIKRELAALQQNYEKRMNRADGAVPPAIKADALAGIARKMDKLTAELKALDAAKAAPAKPEAITDFGEKLPPARRAMAAKLDEALTDADIANRPLSEIWPLAENEAIEDTFAAAVAHAARAEIPAKPRTAYNVRQWVEKVKTLRGLAAHLVTGRYGRDAFIKLVQGQRLRDWLSKVLLLEQIPRDQWKRIGVVEERPDARVYRDGNWVPSPHLRMAIDGKSAYFEGDATVAGNIEAIREKLGSEATDKRMQFEVRGASKGPFKVNKKGDPEYRALMEFATVEEARAAVQEYDGLVAAWEAVKARDNITERDLRKADNRPRVGKDHRGGRDVKPEDFQQQFGFRGGEFGKWVEQGKGDKDRQTFLNNAYDALMDLADLVGIPPRAVSLNGSLGIAFGSRGSGWASAHFEPSNLVINLTKTRGAGALAHEWFHALDNYFSRLRRDGAEAKFTGDQKKYDNENFVTHHPEPMYVYTGRGVHPPMLLADLQRRRKLNPGAAIYNEANWAPDPAHPQGVRPVVERRFAELVEALNNSPMTKRAQSLDKNGRGYWSSTLERAARAFENHVIARMHEQGYQNDFLANVQSIDDFVRNPARYPYLLPGEVKPIAEAFDALFNTVEARTEPSGNVALFNRSAKFTPGLNPIARDRLDKIVQRITAKWKGNGQATVRVVSRWEDMPPEVKQAAKEAGYDNASTTERIPGATFNGTVFLVHENIQSEQLLEETLFHERTHQILRGNASDPGNAQLASALRSLYNRMGGEDGLRLLANQAGVSSTQARMQANALWKSVMARAKADGLSDVDAARRADVAKAVLMTEEFLADLEGHRAYETVPEKVRRKIGEALGLLRQWLHDNGFERIAARFGHNPDSTDLTDLRRILRHLRKQEARTGDDSVRFLFVGVNAKTADTHALSAARARIDAGEDAEAVRRETGWHKGNDGKWRFEISDAKAKFIGLRDGGARKMHQYDDLQDVIDHPALFAAYPALRKVWVEIEVDPAIKDESGVLFAARPEDANTVARAAQINVKARNERDALSVLLHEIQHGVQSVEGFASGGSAANLAVVQKAARDSIPELRATVREAQQSYDDAVDMGYPAAEIAKRKAAIDQARAELDDNVALSGAGDPFGNYLRLAGEVEARNTQTRQRMTDAERRASPPSETQDTPDSTVIVMFNGHEMASAPPPSNAIRDEGTNQATPREEIGASGASFAKSGEPGPSPADVRDLSPEQLKLLRTLGLLTNDQADLLEDGSEDAMARKAARRVLRDISPTMTKEAIDAKLASLAKVKERLQDLKPAVSVPDIDGEMTPELQARITNLGYLLHGFAENADFAFDYGIAPQGEKDIQKIAKAMLEARGLDTPIFTKGETKNDVEHWKVEYRGREGKFEVEPGGLLQLHIGDLMKNSGAGSRLYAVFNAWAARNNYKALPDRRGLSEVNKYRRTASMLSSAMREGSTAHLMPHPDQSLPYWMDGDSEAAAAFNTGYMALREAKRVLDPRKHAHRIHLLNKVRYDFDQSMFVDSKGRAISVGEYDSVLSQAAAGQGAVGRRSAQRAHFAASSWDAIERRGLSARSDVVSWGRLAADAGAQSGLRAAGRPAGDDEANPALELTSDPLTMRRAYYLRDNETPANAGVSASGAATRGLPVEQLKRILGAAAKAMEAAHSGIKVIFVANHAELQAHPDPEAQRIVQQDDYDDTVQAALSPDRTRVFFIADRIKSPKQARTLFAHEAVGHYSMEQMLGPRLFAELRDRLIALKDAGKWPEVFAEVSKRYERNADGTFRPLDDATFAAEAIAVFAERNIRTSILQRAMNAVRGFLRKFFPQLELSQGELRQMLWEAGQYLEGKAYRPDVAARALGERPAPRTQREAVERHAFAKGSEPTIVDRVQELISPKDTTLLQRLKDKAADWRPAALGALQLRHLGELGEDMLPPLAEYADTVQQMQTLRNELQQASIDIVESAMKYQGANKPEALRMYRMLMDATLAGVDPSADHKRLLMLDVTEQGNQEVTPAAVKAFSKKMDELAKLSPGSAQHFIGRKKQAKKLLAQEKKREASHAAMAPEWAKLSPEGKKMWVEISEAYAKQSDKYQDALMESLKAAITDDRQKSRMIAQLKLNFESNRVPFYVPLSRWGEYFVAATAPDGTREFHMQESTEEQRMVKKRLSAAGYTKISSGVKSKITKQLDGASASFIAEVDKVLQEGHAPEKVRNDVYQLYLTTLPEMSMRKNFIHRKGTPGFSEDVVRALASHVFHSSYQIARLKFTHKLDAQVLKAQALADAMAEVDAPDANKAGQMVGELRDRHEWVMNPQDSAGAQKLTTLGFLWYLAVSPAAALVNLLQTVIVSFPVLGARYGFGTAATHLGRTMKQSMKTFGNMDKLTGAEKMTPDEQRAYDEFKRRGTFDKSQVHNLAGLSETDTHTYNPALHKALSWASFLFHRAEVVNREATSMAAYRMAREAGKSHDMAIELGDKAVNQTHFDYSASNRSRYMRGPVAKVLLQFKQYSMGMTWLLGRMAWKSLKDADPATRRENMRALTGVLGMTAVFSGTMGLPMMGMTMGILNAIASAFGDDDEPWDAETEFRAFLREMLGEKGAEYVMRGPAQAATGLGIASRVGLGELWMRSPDREMEGQALAHYYLEQFAGPVAGGMFVSALRGLQLMDEGHVWRGVETMLPKAVKDGMKAIRFADEGVNTLRGDPVVEDLGVFATIAQLMGMAPAAVGNAYDIQGDVKGYADYIRNRRTRLMDAYAMAWRLGDTDAQQETLEKMRAFSSKYPELAITSDSIRKSFQSRARYSAQAQNGIVVDPKIRARLESQLGMAQ